MAGPTTALAGALVEVEGLTVAYGAVVALEDVSLVARPGHLVAVTGHSGAGKSSLLWAIAGAVPPAGGAVRIDGEEVRGRDHGAARAAALIPQGNGLATILSAHENVVMSLVAAGVGSKEAAARAEAALASVGLHESGGHLVEELSGGQQQRVAVARGLALQARVLLADEPTSELDHDNREKVLALLRAQADRGAAVVMATHDPEAAAEADSELRLDDGRLTVVRAARH
jgi:putative ABC transport system ATP-binding protein